MPETPSTADLNDFAGNLEFNARCESDQARLLRWAAAEIDRLRARVSELEAERDALRSRNVELSQEVATLKNEVFIAEETSNFLEEEIESLLVEEDDD